MLIYTNAEVMRMYTTFTNQDTEVKNFRLYYEQKPTNLIWYDGKIVYIPKELFELKNLLNINLNKKYKCSLFLFEVKLLKELKKKNISYLLEDSLEELINLLEASGGVGLNNEVAIEAISDCDYSNIIEPIYLGNGAWMNFKS